LSCIGSNKKLYGILNFLTDYAIMAGQKRLAVQKSRNLAEIFERRILKKECLRKVYSCDHIDYLVV
jgi:hypothetical protein